MARPRIQAKPGADSDVSAMEDGDRKPCQPPAGNGGLHAIENAALGGALIAA
ncbi:hypothetical protein RESH_00348 [Rhodopirellula europaea SH398]|uniref:Uncharacterized protein n=1 Tax=Rhodopirellula europaea SH398 TaxID=1263868 RepID=M5SBP7_9BACT|nr:hypothetical protein RESH_00348 [Rhodopirellula europaea SH398]